MTAEYAYDHFEVSMLAEDRSFTSGVRPGEPFPAFDLDTVDGTRVSGTDLLGRRPVLLYFASVT